MKKKILSLVLICFVISLSIFLLSACTNNADEDVVGPTVSPTNNKIVVVFDSSVGELEFTSKTFYKNEEGIVYISERDCPAITNEGENKMFSCWVNGGKEFDFTTPLSSGIKLQAEFVDAEMVVKCSWSVNDSLFSKEYSIHSASFNGQRYGGVYKNMYVKVPKSEATANNYLLKSEKDTYSNACFVTSSNNKEQIVTKNDLTLDTYRLSCYIVSCFNNFLRNSLGYFDYVPKGVKPALISEMGLAKYAIKYNFGHAPVQFAMDEDYQSLKYNFSTDSTISNYLKIEEIRGYSLFDDSVDSDYTADFCNVFLELANYKFSYESTGLEYVYNYVEEGRLYEDVSEELFDAIDYVNN